MNMVIAMSMITTITTTMIMTTGTITPTIPTHTRTIPWARVAW